MVLPKPDNGIALRNTTPSAIPPSALRWAGPSVSLYAPMVLGIGTWLALGSSSCASVVLAKRSTASELR